MPLTLVKSCTNYSLVSSAFFFWFVFSRETAASSIRSLISIFDSIGGVR